MLSSAHTQSDQEIIQALFGNRIQPTEYKLIEDEKDIVIECLRDNFTRNLTTMLGSQEKYAERLWYTTSKTPESHPGGRIFLDPIEFKAGEGIQFFKKLLPPNNDEVGEIKGTEKGHYIIEEIYRIDKKFTSDKSYQRFVELRKSQVEYLKEYFSTCAYDDLRHNFKSHKAAEPKETAGEKPKGPLAPMIDQIFGVTKHSEGHHTVYFNHGLMFQLIIPPQIKIETDGTPENPRIKVRIPRVHLINYLSTLNPQGMMLSPCVDANGQIIGGRLIFVEARDHHAVNPALITGLIDKSSSMDIAPSHFKSHVEELKEIFKTLNKASPHADLFLGSFSDELDWSDCESLNDLTQINDYLDNQRAYGSTRLVGSIRDALLKMKENTEFNKTLIILTDGKDNNSGSELLVSNMIKEIQELINEMNAANTPIKVFYVYMKDATLPDILKPLIDATQGTILHEQDPASLVALRSHAYHIVAPRKLVDLILQIKERMIKQRVEVYGGLPTVVPTVLPLGERAQVNKTQIQLSLNPRAEKSWSLTREQDKQSPLAAHAKLFSRAQQQQGAKQKGAAVRQQARRASV